MWVYVTNMFAVKPNPLNKCCIIKYPSSLKIIHLWYDHVNSLNIHYLVDIMYVDTNYEYHLINHVIYEDVLHVSDINASYNIFYCCISSEIRVTQPVKQ